MDTSDGHVWDVWGELLLDYLSLAHLSFIESLKTVLCALLYSLQADVVFALF